MEFILLGLANTLLIGGLVFDWFDDDDDSSDDPPQDGMPPDNMPPDAIGTVLTFDGSHVLTGTEGNDTVPADQDDDVDAPSLIDLLGGDDIATVNVNDAVTIAGGEGNDSLTATGVLNTVSGGAGDDTLVGDDSNRLLGGAGNDDITFQHGSYDQGDQGLADGGTGDDTINILADAFVPDGFEVDFGGVDVRGGSGADEFNVTYAFNDNIPLEEDDVASGRFIEITDFDPSEDMLQIEIDRQGDLSEVAVTAELDQVEQDDGTFASEITLMFEETNTTPASTNVLRVISNEAFSLDDIELVGLSPVEDTPPLDDGQVLTFDGSDVLTGTEGDDTVPAYQDDDVDAPSVISLRGGDDVANVDVNDPLTISGGEGNDSLTATGVLNTVEGGAGNDTLVGDDSNQLLGGTGNDDITFEHGSYDQGDQGLADGGAGNDTINILADAFVPDGFEADVGGVDVRGGSGADEFNVTYVFNDDNSFEETDVVSGQFIQIEDFDPREDSLQIEVDRQGDMSDGEVTVDLDQTEQDDGTFFSVITLMFEATDAAPAATNVLRVASNAAFTLDDVQVVGI